jgi:hypothetical protein
VFEHFRSLALRLKNEHLNCLKAIHRDSGTKFRNASLDQFCRMVLISSFLPRVCLNIMELLNERTAL